MVGSRNYNHAHFLAPATSAYLPLRRRLCSFSSAIDSAATSASASDSAEEDCGHEWRKISSEQTI
ncbi:hypothetical protein C2845_PM01G47930 [Panicum miliaceum]|uniref:Uncharacterized protein n=1 Tax=Panicum miliaceum TaxID=4540 RepID=A0A3L6TJT4_PANMI|nr:hypothetical protein C2845_PM01G47930 [Panicum miliaceum]